MKNNERGMQDAGCRMHTRPKCLPGPLEFAIPHSLLAMGCLLAAPMMVSADEPVDPRLTSKAFRAAAAKVAPSIVTLEGLGGALPVVKPPREQPEPPRQDGPGPRGPRRRQASPFRDAGAGPTTGVIISPDGFVVSSTFGFRHEPPVITAEFADGSRRVARLRGRDERRGLCVLKIDGVRDLPVPAVAPRAGLRAGQWVVALGVGFGGDAPSFSAGILSAVDRLSGMAVQTDANLSPANYGGPLVDLDGRVAALCVSITPRTGGAAGGVQWYDSGIGFAVPLDGLEPLLDDLKSGKVFKPGRLGIQPARGGGADGVKVETVQKKSPAHDAGIKPQDVIVALDDRPVRDIQSLRVLLRPHAASETVSIKLKRGDQELTVPVTLNAGDEELPPPDVPDLRDHQPPRDPAPHKIPIPIPVPPPKPDE
jgi:serine protease Do